MAILKSKACISDFYNDVLLNEVKKVPTKQATTYSVIPTDARVLACFATPLYVLKWYPLHNVLIFPISLSFCFFITPE